MPRRNDFKTEATPAMGYLIGATLSDGSIWAHLHSTRGTREFRLQFDQIDVEMVEYLNECLKEITGRSYPVRPFNQSGKQTSYRLIAYGNAFIEWLLSETSMKLRIPRFTETTSRDFRLALLAGLIDGDGWISQGKTKAGTPRWVCGCVTADPWLDEMIVLAEELGIGTHPKEKNRLSVSGRQVYDVRFREADLARSGITLRVARKQSRLEALRAWLDSSETLRLPLAKDAR